jgi:hypothetical protein
LSDRNQWLVPALTGLERDMTKIGKVLTFLFPNFVERLLYLDTLSQKIIIEEVFQRASENKSKDTLDSLIKEFNSNKMWFMKTK